MRGQALQPGPGAGPLPSSAWRAMSPGFSAAWCVVVFMGGMPLGWQTTGWFSNPPLRLGPTDALPRGLPEEGLQCWGDPWTPPKEDLPAADTCAPEATVDKINTRSWVRRRLRQFTQSFNRCVRCDAEASGAGAGGLKFFFHGAIWTTGSLLFGWLGCLLLWATAAAQTTTGMHGVMRWTGKHWGMCVQVFLGPHWCAVGSSPRNYRFASCWK